MAALWFQHFQHLAGMTRALPLVVFSVGLGVFESERIKRKRGGLRRRVNSTSCIGLAFLHKTALCRAAQGLTITTYRFRFTRVFLALLDECGLGSPGQRLSILADGLSLTGTLGQSRGDQKY